MVSRLAAALRIEEGVGEDRKRISVLLADRHDLGRELGEITIAVKSENSHRFSRGSATALGPSAYPLRRGSPTPEKTPVAGS